MTSPHPPPLEDGGDDRLDIPRDDGRQPPASRAPNYFARRAIVIGVIVAVLAATSVIVGRIIGADGDSDPNEPDRADWNTVVVVAEDEVRLVDPETGEVTATYPGDEVLLDAESLVSGGTLVLMNDFGRITQLDLGDGTIHRSSAQEGSTLTLNAENASIVLAGPPIGGDVTVVDTAARTSFDVGAVAGLVDPLMFVADVLVNPSGTHVATPDARTFQSVVVDVATETAVPLAGQVVALDDETAVTALRAGARAELEFYDLLGERRGSADAPSPQVTMLTGDATAIIVAADGAIASVVANGKVAELGVLGPDEDGGGAAVEVRDGVPTFESQRLLLTTAREVALVDTEGAVLARVAGELLSVADRQSKCAFVGSSRPAGTAVHIDLETGDVLGEVAGGIVGSSSADGCTVSLLGEPRIVARGVDVELGDAAGSITVAPDGSAYVLSTPTGERLVRIADDTEEPREPIDLADEAVLIRFVQI